MIRPSSGSPSWDRGSSAPPATWPRSRSAASRRRTASDVFSLGVILFELATGQTAFPGPNLLQVLDQIRSVEPAALAARVPEPFAVAPAPPLDPDPDRRTITMREVAETLAGPPEAGMPPLVFDSPPVWLSVRGLVGGGA